MSNILPDVFPIDESKERKFDHVPVGGIFVVHYIQSCCHVGVTIVTTQIVLKEKKLNCRINLIFCDLPQYFLIFYFFSIIYFPPHDGF